MDLEKLLKIASTFLSLYVRDFMRTLATPWTKDPVPDGRIRNADGTLMSQPPAPSDPLTTLNADLWVFVFLSIFIGTTLAGLATAKRGAELQAVVTYVAISWLAFSIYAFALARYVLRGKAQFVDSARATLYCLGVTFVVASFVSLLGSILVAPINIKGTVYSWLPKVLYLCTQGCLLSFLLTRNFKALNALKGWRLVVFVVLAPVPILLINILVSLGVFSEMWMADSLRK
jgi:ABC-type transport system involved in cytochrome c biogenesis permease subunit